ncbi:hypothetical protein F4827_002276 [Paraburkholderia bannensis]|uniref:Uncharacterized protein n=1 Tax=Paraburkholderia bannensis TaxID=765414 RepID=A0A7W9TW27_9BURK|nr:MULTISPECIES: hypothetical protein [Paraburkholderia]MBB3257177.1 hypothetical protein [Paraburkholderia sp. WP4_3_2]MBB6102427.1 hypothetical protein [Paraburkholderia bannensis]
MIERLFKAGRGFVHPSLSNVELKWDNRQSSAANRPSQFAVQMAVVFLEPAMFRQYENVNRFPQKRFGKEPMKTETSDQHESQDERCVVNGGGADRECRDRNRIPDEQGKQAHDRIRKRICIY